MLIEQGLTSIETRRTLPIGDTTRTMAGNQYQYNWTIIQI